MGLERNSVVLTYYSLFIYESSDHDLRKLFSERNVYMFTVFYLRFIGFGKKTRRDQSKKPNIW